MRINKNSSKKIIHTPPREDTLKKEKEDIITKEELSQLLFKTKGNFTQIGKEYGVTDNTIRKWCKKMDLPFHSSDYRPPKKTRQKLVKKPVKQIDPFSQKIIARFPSIADAERITKISHIYQAANPAVSER